MGSSGYTGQNPAAGAAIAYLVNAIAADATAKLEVVDGAGTVVRQLPFNRTGPYRPVWDMRAGAPLTGPVSPPATPEVAAVEVAAGRRTRGAGWGRSLLSLCRARIGPA